MTTATENRVWLVWSNEHSAWWRADAAGYTYKVAEAGRYTEADAIRHCQSRTPTPTSPRPEVMLMAPEAQIVRLDSMPDAMVRAEVLRLISRYELPGSSCHAGHENEVPIALWECPRCCERLRERLARLRGAMDALAEFECEGDKDKREALAASGESCDCIPCCARVVVSEDNARRDRPVEPNRP